MEYQISFRLNFLFDTLLNVIGRLEFGRFHIKRLTNNKAIHPITTFIKITKDTQIKLFQS